AGFDGVEVHGANHYAVHQFFSPRANHRVDNWGGTLSKRMNFPLAVAQAVRDALGPKLIAGFRITPFESEPGGYLAAPRFLDSLLNISTNSASTFPSLPH